MHFYIFLISSTTSGIIITFTILLITFHFFPNVLRKIISIGNLYYLLILFFIVIGAAINLNYDGLLLLSGLNLIFCWFVLLFTPDDNNFRPLIEQLKNRRFTTSRIFGKKK